MLTRFGILGSGVVGQTLAAGLVKDGYEARIATRTPGKLKDFTAETGIVEGTFGDVASWAEGLVLAVARPWSPLTRSRAGRPRQPRQASSSSTSPNPIDYRSTRRRRAAVLHRAQRVADGAAARRGSRREVREGLQQRRATPRWSIPSYPGRAADDVLLRQRRWRQSHRCAASSSNSAGNSPTWGPSKAARAIEPLCQLWCIPGFRENGGNTRSR